jgi:RNA polymerase sigma-70 factor (ECF subfamily)
MGRSAHFPSMAPRAAASRRAAEAEHMDGRLHGRRDAVAKGCLSNGERETEANEMRLSQARVQGPVAAAENEPHDWVAALAGPPAVREEALATLHALLLHGARFELNRRREALRHVRDEEVDDLALRAARDALVAILAALDSFRGASRFTTWAQKFVLLEVGVAARRRAWHGRAIDLDIELPETLRALRDAMEASLTPHQRDVFAALALNGVPIDVLAERLNTTRSGLYATLHDARQRLRAVMVDGAQPASTANSVK